MSSSEGKELLNREPLLPKSLLELVSRKVLCWKSACCISLLCVYPTCSTTMFVRLPVPDAEIIAMCNTAVKCKIGFAHQACTMYRRLGPTVTETDKLIAETSSLHQDWIRIKTCLTITQLLVVTSRHRWSTGNTAAF